VAVDKGPRRGDRLPTLPCMTRWPTTLAPPTLHPGNRGDVPGWVLITLMTAGLVIGVWTAAGPALAGVFDQAISRVTSF
jgi:hypothetical protein